MTVPHSLPRVSSPSAATGSAALPQIPTKGGSPCIANRCSACCHDTEMLLTEADVQRLTPLAQGRTFHVLMEDGYLQLRTLDAPAVKGMQGKPCVFLDGEGKCSVHAARPEGCRLYPAMWDEDAGRAVLDADGCPHTDRFLLPQATADAVRRLADRLHAERDARVKAVEDKARQLAASGARPA